MRLYEQLADSIAQSIQAVMLCKVDKLSSVRLASTQRNVSPSTVFQAYYLLEAKGLIPSRANVNQATKLARIRNAVHRIFYVA